MRDDFGPVEDFGPWENFGPGENIGPKEHLVHFLHSGDKVLHKYNIQQLLQIQQ